ncbi:Protein of unknown function [Gryllus bimaculatus]|nr:Protein of unknown function [Gryllus bimaculatus]
MVRLCVASFPVRASHRFEHEADFWGLDDRCDTHSSQVEKKMSPTDPNLHRNYWMNSMSGSKKINS